MDASLNEKRKIKMEVEKLRKKCIFISYKKKERKELNTWFFFGIYISNTKRLID